MRIYLGLMRRLYWYMLGSKSWMRRWMLLSLEELGVGFSTYK